jgi:AcrR family transcriptional regulator
MGNSKTNTDDIKLRLLSEARSVFARFGYNKATVDDIAKAAGKGKSTFYYYFSSKEEVFKAVIEKEANLFRAKLIESISVEAAPIDKVKNYILTRLLSFKELVNLFTAISSGGMDQVSFIEDVRKKYEQEQVNIIKMILLESVNNEEVNVNDIDLVTEAMAVILKGLEYHLMFKPDEVVAIEAKVDKVLDLVFKGITKHTNNR